MRDSFVFYRSFYEAIADLPDADLAACFRAISEYALNDIEPEVPGIAKTVFKMAKPQIDANTKRYQNGAKGGRPVKSDADNNQTITKQKPNNNQTKPKCEIRKPNVNDNVNVNDNDNENENVNVNDKNNMSSGTSADHTSEYPYKAVIDYLNTKMGTDYKSSSKDSQKHIRARFQEGYKLEDFYTVIDKKVREWKGTEWEKFLRPAPLFGTKFESYLNQKGRMNSTQTGGNKFNNFTPRDYDYQDMEKSLLGVK